MPKQKAIKSFIVSFRALLLIGLAIGIAGSAVIVHADQYDEQIKALNNQNAAARGNVNTLLAQAGSYQQAISQLQQQIGAIQAALSASQAKQTELQGQIAEAQNKITIEKQFLTTSIRAMYTDGQLSTIEQLATSKNLSDYVDKEEYRTAVQNKMNATIKEISAMQVKLQKQKAELEVVIKSQQDQNAQLASAQAQQQSMLAYNEGQQAAFNSQISSNNSKISELRQQQIVANARFIGGGAGSGPTCGGGYPSKWCNAPQDSLIDSWGMYNRECVSYTAFRVAASGRYMPYWGGVGNANQWDDNARRAGIPVDQNPQPGDVAISNSGYYGHAMYVEGVNSDGTINISQYNASLNGTYSTRYGLSVGSLVFLHF